MRLAIIVTHPVQYYAPVFQMLQRSGKVDIKVFYTAGEAGKIKFDHGFKKEVEWDIPLLNGYEYEWVKNTSKQPGSHHFKGIVNPDIISDINKFNPNAVLIYGWGYNSHLKVLRHFKGRVPILFRGDSTLIDQQSAFRSLLRSLLLRWVYKHVDHVFYPGSNSKAYFEHYGVKDEQLIFAPHATDNERFAEDNMSEAAALRQQFGISNDELLLLFAGKFENKKDPLLLLKAFKAANIPKLHLLMVGNGELEHALKMEADSNKNIHFLNFKNQSVMPAIYQACNIFCLPSKGPAETWGLAVNEAMASGRAVLVSDKVGCAVDLVRDDHNGFVFSSGSVTDLSAKLNTLAAKGINGLKAMGENSKNIVYDWSFKVQVNAILKTIGSI